MFKPADPSPIVPSISLGSVHDPAGLVGPATLAAPVTPLEPREPGAPAGPNSPEGALNLVAPVTPGTPAMPTVPTNHSNKSFNIVLRIINQFNENYYSCPKALYVAV